MVERGVKMVTKASSKVYCQAERDAYIRQQIKSRTLIPEYRSKKDIFPLIKEWYYLIKRTSSMTYAPIHFSFLNPTPGPTGWAIGHSNGPLPCRFAFIYFFSLNPTPDPPGWAIGLLNGPLPCLFAFIHFSSLNPTPGPPGWAIGLLNGPLPSLHAFIPLSTPPQTDLRNKI